MKQSDVDELPDVVVEVIGEIIAEERKAWIREREHIEAEARATIAEQRAEIAELRAQTASMMAELTATTQAALLNVEKALSSVKDGKDGEPGPQGQKGDPGVPGQDADPDRIIAVVKAEVLAALPPPEKGDPGHDADPKLIAEMVADEVQRELNSWHRPVDGKDADPEAVAEIVLAKLPPPQKGEPGKDADLEVVSAKAAALVLERMPMPQDGKDADPDVVAELVLQRLPKPKDGEKGDRGDRGDDVDMDVVAVMIEEATRQAVSQWPVPQDGKDADPALIRQLVKEEVAGLPPPEKGEKGDRGEKGIGVDWLEIRDGNLVVKWSDDDENMQDLGRVVGERGERGHDADPDLIMKFVNDAVAAVAKEIRVPQDGKDGKDGVGMAGLVIDRDGCCLATMTDGSIRNLGQIVGKDGEPGRDGLSIEDLTGEFDGDRVLTLRFTRGEISKTIPIHLPIPIYRGFWDEKAAYEFGDGVSFGGSMWLAQKDTTKKPSTNCEDWRLAVKAGRDGRDGKPGEKGDRGPDGRAGRDFTVGKS